MSGTTFVMMVITILVLLFVLISVGALVFFD
jgi:septal ring-binding cell division protein DamX